QFNSDITNHRTDEYGGDLAQRLTFMKEVIKAVVDTIGTERTMVRFSAHKADIPNYMWEDPEMAIRIFIEAFKEAGATMIHPSIMQFDRVLADGKTMHQLVRKYWDGVIIGVGTLNPEMANQAIEEGIIDVAAFGRPFISNPDFIHRLKNGEKLEEYDVKKHLHTLI
ncbi:alkene reductase, partial [Bacillus sp. sid0103]|nr:alkene reductase [Bacillus sp. sid0103]